MDCPKCQEKLLENNICPKCETKFITLQQGDKLNQKTNSKKKKKKNKPPTTPVNYRVLFALEQ